MAAPRSEITGTAAGSILTVEFLTAGIVVFTDDIISSANFESGAFDKIGCDFFSSVCIHALDCRTRYMHLFGALFLSETDIVDQPYCFIFFDCHNLNIILIFIIFTVKKVVLRKITNSFAFFRSCHVSSSFPVVFPDRYIFKNEIAVKRKTAIKHKPSA